MTYTTRRELLAGASAAAVAVAIPAAQAAIPENESDLERMNALLAQIAEIESERDTIPDDDASQDAFYDRKDVIGDELAAVPATSLAGCLFKAWALSHDPHRDLIGGCWSLADDQETDLINTLYAGLERLHGGPLS